MLVWLRRRTLAVILGLSLVVVDALSALASAQAAVNLPLDQRVTLRVGDTAILRLALERDYSIGGAGDSLVLLSQEEQQGEAVYSYRAVAVGDQVFVATPRESGPDGCVSCVTGHYFVTVVE